MNANRNHANRPTALSASDRARIAAAIRAHDARAIAKRRSERVARRAVFALILAIGLIVFYSASAPTPDAGRYSLVTPNGNAIATGLTIGDCVERTANNLFSCDLER